MTKQRKLSSGFEESIRAAFPVEPLPSKVTTSNLPDCQEITSWLTGRQWDVIQSELIEKLSGDLSLYTSEYFRYILPAYLLHAYKTQDSQFTFFTVCGLQPDSLHAPIFKQFTAPQREVVRRFLSWAASRLGDSEAEKVLKMW